MTQTITATQARQNFSQLLNSVFRRERRVVIEKSGIPVAVLVSAADFQQLRRFEEKQQEAFAVLETLREAFKDVPAQEIEQEVARAIAQVRAQNPIQAPASQP